MLSKVTKEMDESHDTSSDVKQINNQSNSFAELPSELTITEDHRAGIRQDFQYHMATFEASKKLLRETVDPKDK